MTTIHERLYTAIPAGRAAEYLNELASGRGAARGVKAVQVEFHPSAGSEDESRQVAVAWRPLAGYRGPSFTGSIILCTDEGSSLCCLAVEGTYVPEAGSAGGFLDEIAGNKAARDTARRLLNAIAEAMERSHRAAFATMVS